MKGRFLVVAVSLTAISLPAVADSSWHVETDTGAGYDVLPQTIQRLAQSSGPDHVILVVRADEGDSYRLIRLIFDCHGHFEDITGTGPFFEQYAAPRSVAGKIAAMVCRPAPPPVGVYADPSKPRP